MIRKAIYAAVLLATLVSAVACYRGEKFDERPEPDGDYVKIEFSADIPELDTQALGTRAVDPDGGGVRDITLFCFDNFGLFITTVKAELTTETVMTGTFTASVPRYTRRIHFVANQNMTDFRESAFINKSEAEVLALLEGSAGQMIYWARFACAFLNPQDEQVQTTIADDLRTAGNKITMLRNHALITIDNPAYAEIPTTAAENAYINIVGIEAYNIYAYGTVAPYHPDLGFDFTLEEWKNSDFVTIPQRDAKQSDIRSVTSTTSQFIFEHENTSDDPVSIILRGRPAGATQDLYYRVLLIDGNGSFVPVRRNHRYVLHINGPLSYGQPTFDEALTASATNNVWISISDMVNEVEDTKRILRVYETSVVRNEADFTVDKSIVLNYSVKSKDGTRITKEADMPTVTWLDNTVAAQEIRHDEFNPNAEGTEGVGTIVVSPRALGSNDRLEGTLLVKLGRLQRKIKIILIKEQSFAPSWMSSGIYGEEVETNEPSLDPDGTPGTGTVTLRKLAHVTLMFTIPETYPSELFPMKVYITAPELDIRSESGMMLPVVHKGDKDWYQSENGPANVDYKFVFTVNKPGKQRIYFENILKQEDGYKGTVYVEAEHFATLTRTYTFSELRHAISVSNMEMFTMTDVNEGTAEDEFVYFYRVPQKTGAHVELYMELREKISDDAGVQYGELVNATAKDEFLFYSQNLNNYVDGEYDPTQITLNCRFAPYTAKAEAWQQARNENGGRMLMFKPIITDAPIEEIGKYTLHLYTNCAQSAELVRISSNLNNQPAVSLTDPDDTVDDTPENIAAGTNNLYGGTVYRSFVFELANYAPFRFGARLRYDNGTWEGANTPVTPPSGKSVVDNAPELLTPLTWSFEPGKSVEIAIDVTSFMGPDGKSIDPFGRPFEIYIDAPMLRLADDATLAAYKLNGTKLKADPNVPGRFIYTVEARRDAERAFGMEAAMNTDAAAAAGAQAGERKILPFVVNSVASAGDIVVSSNEAQTVFYPETFRVTNESIKGRIQYAQKQPDGSTVYIPVKKDTFVAFERISNGNRIGAVTMTADGEFELRLRKEYTLNWNSYGVAFHFEHVEENGHNHLHHANYGSLAEMYNALQNGEVVKLEIDAVE